MLGFNLVMPADPERRPEAAPRAISALTRLAHAARRRRRGRARRAALRRRGGAPHGGTTTDPEAAAAFVAATGVDLLAVSVGNVHIKIDGSAGLDLDRLAAIRRRVPVPLVLHGGTGIDRRRSARPSRWAWRR